MFRFGDPGGRMCTSVGVSNANILAYWSSVSNGSSWSISAGNGRTGGSCLRLTNPSGGTDYTLRKTLDAQSTWGSAFALKTGSYPNGSSGLNLCTLFDSGSQQVGIWIAIDGTIAATRNGTTLGSTSVSVPLNSWTHIEFKATINSTTGTVQVWINGVSRLSLTSQNTKNTANSTANVVAIGPIASNLTGSFNVDFDDIIFYDAQSTDANGFSDITGPIGDCGLTWIQPTGAGTTTQFTADTGSNYARVNEATPDGDTSYVESSTIGQIDTYATADLAATAATVKSVAAIHYAKKTDVGTRGMKSELRSGGGNTSHATEISLGNSYQYYFSNWGQNPNNGTATNWTPTSVNALEIGQTVSS